MARLAGREGPERRAAFEHHAVRGCPGWSSTTTVRRRARRSTARKRARWPRCCGARPGRAEDWSHTPPSEWWIVFRFHSAVEVLGRDRVRAVRVAGSSGGPDVSAGMLLRAIGCRGLPVPGLPFDEAAGTVPHERDRARGLPGTYAVGRIERGLGWHRGRGRHGDAGASGRSTAYTVTA
ncbi:hypothetical protein ACF1A9_24275 [Streptomyces sp. NPDC014872]|uniref:hypothetical protein n=1 Tax=Streptomyces sp. NPDC014872 TaxID=3364926 RepID=UPI003701F795